MVSDCQCIAVWAVIRVDSYSHGDGVSIEQRFTIKEVLPTRAEAEGEVARLVELKRRKKSSASQYFVAKSVWYVGGLRGSLGNTSM